MLREAPRSLIQKYRDASAWSDLRIIRHAFNAVYCARLQRVFVSKKFSEMSIAVVSKDKDIPKQRSPTVGHELPFQEIGRKPADLMQKIKVQESVQDDNIV